MKPMTLDTYVQQTASLPWAWGTQDCTMWVADWCRIRWGCDPAAAFRGRYNSRAGAEALTERGLIETVEPEISLTGKNDPSEGDIGVIAVDGRQVAAIWSGVHWMFRTPRGIGMTDRPALAVWGD